MSVTFDSWAWVEYLAGTRIGLTVKEYVDSDRQIYTPSLCLMEIKAKCIREKKEYADYIRFIEERSAIVDISREVALEAADIRASEGLPSVDALIYACARLNKTELLTGDRHFSGKRGVIFLK